MLYMTYEKDNQLQSYWDYHQANHNQRPNYTDMQFTSPKLQIQYEIVKKAKPRSKNMRSSIKKQTYNSKPKRRQEHATPKSMKRIKKKIQYPFLRRRTPVHSQWERRRTIMPANGGYVAGHIAHIPCSPARTVNVVVFIEVGSWRNSGGSAKAREGLTVGFGEAKIKI